MTEVEQLRTEIAGLSNWLGELQESHNTLAAVVQNLSKQDPETPDPFNDLFESDVNKGDPEPVEKKPTPSELLEKLWSMESGSEMDFLDGHIEMIRKPGTYPAIQYYGMLVTDPGEIRIVHPNFTKGYQLLSIRAAWASLAGPMPEIAIWFRLETDQTDWVKDYVDVWEAAEAHQRKSMYNINTGLTHAYGEFTCAAAKEFGRVDGAPDYKTLKEIWLK